MTNKPPPSEAAEHVDPLLKKLRGRDKLSAEEERVLRDAVSEVRKYPAGKTFIRAGVTINECTLLCDGIVSRFKDLADGQRQIQQLHVAGDFLDLHSFLLKQLDHNVGALTDVRLAMVPHDAITMITDKYPHLARVLWFSTLLDAAINRETILSIGRRTALARIAHLLCELNVRLGMIGLASNGRFALALTQTDIADTTGLTSVHVNRMLKKLRDDGVATFRAREVIIHDWDRLQKLAEFDPGYLHLEPQPR